MYILASKREYPTLQDYVDSGKFDLNQYGVIRSAFNAGLTPKQISVFADPVFDVWQMVSMSDAFIDGFTIGQVSVIADPRFSAQQMDCIKDVMGYPRTTPEDISLIANPEYSLEQMSGIAGGIASDLSGERLKQYVDIITEDDWDLYQIDQILSGFRNDVSFDRILLYANPAFDYDQMEYLAGAASYGHISDEVLREMANTTYTPLQMQAICVGRQHNLSDENIAELLSIAADPDITYDQIDSLCDGYVVGMPREWLDIFVENPMNRWATEEIIAGYESGLPLTAVKFYAKPYTFSVLDMRKIRQALEHGVTVEELVGHSRDEIIDLVGDDYEDLGD